MTILNLKIEHKGYTCTVNLYFLFVNAISYRHFLSRGSIEKRKQSL